MGDPLETVCETSLPDYLDVVLWRAFGESTGAPKVLIQDSVLCSRKSGSQDDGNAIGVISCHNGFVKGFGSEIGMKRFFTVLGMLALAACTQSPSNVVYKEGNSSGRGNYSRNTGPSSSERPMSGYEARAIDERTATGETTSTVKIDSVGVSDLPPPSAAPAPAPASAPPVPPHNQHGEVTLTPSSSEPANAPAAVAPSAPAAKSMIWPVEGKVLSHFGPQGKGQAEDGIRIAAAEGEPVYAALDGEVAYVGDQLKGFGHMIILRHSGDKHTTYAHLSRASAERYDRVKQGQIIGYVGKSGKVKEPQLYFAVKHGKEYVDPEKFLAAAG